MGIVCKDDYDQKPRGHPGVGPWEAAVAVAIAEEKATTQNGAAKGSQKLVGPHFNGTDFPRHGSDIFLSENVRKNISFRAGRGGDVGDVHKGSIFQRLGESLSIVSAGARGEGMRIMGSSKIRLYIIGCARGN
ncbi:phosphoribosylglycinamide formyltransferase, formyltetrahydrofolate-dependent [Anopheles sinensis]|uniref:Phosphoribosylglycinamide formyltransferase, formyltetrahydrofolate-dependent n=1 Tax=Anopheles sinensis TaxID=74873 RepID=A0A084VEP4_ANOSI|nr:phosphoribosylglycinamide formyltransferase, formyltetrahydrofolate-dependent [Anopheles sinensis]